MSALTILPGIGPEQIKSDYTALEVSGKEAEPQVCSHLIPFGKGKIWARTAASWRSMCSCADEATCKILTSLTIVVGVQEGSQISYDSVGTTDLFSFIWSNSSSSN